MSTATVHEWCSAAVVMVTTGEEAGKVVRGSERERERRCFAEGHCGAGMSTERLEKLEALGPILHLA